MINSDWLGRELVDHAPEAGRDRGEGRLIGCRFSEYVRRSALSGQRPKRLGALMIAEIRQLGDLQKASIDNMVMFESAAPRN